MIGFRVEWWEESPGGIVFFEGIVVDDSKTGWLAVCGKDGLIQTVPKRRCTYLSTVGEVA